MARSILHEHLGNDTTIAEVEEIMANVWKVTQEVMGKITHDAAENLPQYLRDGLRKFYESRSAGRGQSS